MSSPENSWEDDDALSEHCCAAAEAIHRQQPPCNCAHFDLSVRAPLLPETHDNLCEVDMLNLIASHIPRLSATKHKGEMGRLAVVGGSKEDQDYADVDQWITRAHAVLVGPGLGLSANLPSASKIGSQPGDSADETTKLANELGGVTIVRKGPIDVISDGKTTVLCEEEGSPRRCGGQGDLLAGTALTFMHWFNQELTTKRSLPFPVGIGASLAACALARRCSKLAFGKYGRAMLTVNMIPEIQHAFQQLFGS